MWELKEAVVRKSWDTLLNMELTLTSKTIVGYVNVIMAVHLYG